MSSISNIWNIPERTVPKLDKHFLLYWSGSWIISQSKEGTILRDGIEYIVIYFSVTRGKVLANQNLQYPLSFRKLGSDAYVLIGDSAK